MTTPPRLCIHDVERARTDGWRDGFNRLLRKYPTYANSPLEPHYYDGVRWGGWRRAERAAKEARTCE